jgi:AcrR family transcriptional regulator
MVDSTDRPVGLLAMEGAGSVDPVTVSPRRTQEERSTETRNRILDATVRSLVDHGYAGTTTSAIQALAGVSRGALMHHFSSKADLMVNAVRHLADQRGENLRRQAAGLPEGHDRVSQAMDLLWETFTGPLFTATLELWTAARTDPELRVAVYAWERSLRDDLAAVMQDLFGTEMAARDQFTEAIEITLQFMRGAALTSILRSDREKQQRIIDQWKVTFAWLLGDGRNAT